MTQRPEAREDRKIGRVWPKGCKATQLADP